jgi:phage N-6-adenine-methyltransferase
LIPLRFFSKRRTFRAWQNKSLVATFKTTYAVQFAPASQRGRRDDGGSRETGRPRSCRGAGRQGGREVSCVRQGGRIANRVKDAKAFEAALLGKLEAQRDFAAQYVALFPHGVRADFRSDSTVRSGDDWCLSFAIHVRTVRRCCELLDAATYVDQKNAIFKRCWSLAEMLQAANFSSASIEWYTPAQYIEAVREVLGGIDLDPASSAQANSVVRASEFFSKDDDGLARDWRGRIFLNPPYGKTADGASLAAAFCSKAIDQFNARNIDAGIILVNSLHSQSWQAPLYDHAICLVDHRIQFVSADGEENKNPTFQNIFVDLGNDVSKFAEIFSRFGYVMHKLEATAGIRVVFARDVHCE